MSLCLGYVPKDLAYSLSQILDHEPHFFTILSISYLQSANKLTVTYGLADCVLRDQRQNLGSKADKSEVASDSKLYFLRSLPRMPRDLKRAVYSLQNKHNLNRMAFLKATEVQVEVPREFLVDADDGTLNRLSS